MRRKRIRNLLVTSLLAVMLCGTVANAAINETFVFELVAQKSDAFGPVEKNNNYSTSYVASQTISPYYATMAYQVVNPGGFVRSNEVKIKGVGNTDMSYSGYTVNKGDSLMLKGTNYVSDNGGVSVYVTGTWTP